MDTQKSEYNVKIWLFKNHLGELRYINYHRPPIKVFVYEKVFDHFEPMPKPHGSDEYPMEYYRNSDKKIWYWGLEDKGTFEGNSTCNLWYFNPEEIGIRIPAGIVAEKYRNMTFDDDPVLITEV